VHLFFDQLPQLFRRRVAAPLRLEHQHHLREVIRRQPNLFRLLGAAMTPLNVGVYAEKDGAQNKEMDERLV